MPDSTTLSALAAINPRTAIPLGREVSFVGMDDVSESFTLRRTHDRHPKDLGPGYTRFRENDLLFAKITPCMENGKGAPARGLTNGYGLGSTEFHVLRPRHPESRAFIAQWLAFDHLRLAAEAQMTGSAGQRRVPTDFFDRFQIPDLPLDEQRRIAEILDALDDQTRLIENTLSKQRATFVGLLFHLLTQSLPSDITTLGDAVLEFGGTSIVLPKEWTIEPIGQLLESVDPAMRSGPFGSALLKHELVESGVPLLGIDNVHVDRFVADFRRFVTPAKAVELSRYRVRPADVMITIMGTVGRSCLVPEDIGLALSSKHVWTLTFNDARYRPYLASLQLNHAPWARAHLRRDEQGGIMSAIRSDTLKTLMLPTPPIEEQLKIEEILKAHESTIVGHEQSLIKLRTLKAGLAGDLLTGRVRVPNEVGS